MGGGVTGCAFAASERKRRRAAASVFMRLALDQRRGGAERAAHLVRDRGGLLEVAVRADAHAVEAVVARDLDRLVEPRELAGDVGAEALGAFHARECTQLQPQCRALA